MADRLGTGPFSTECPKLLQQHLGHLRSSGISDEVIMERDYESVLGRKRLADLGFSAVQQRTPGILIPLYGVDGSSIAYEYRPDHPRYNTRGKPIKYENPTGSSIRLDIPPRCRPMLGSVIIPCCFVEGVKKGDALASQGACAIALNGVWGFKGRNVLGGTTLLADFDYVDLKERQAFVIYDSDYATNPQVHKAQDRLLEHLKRKGSQASVVHLPPKPNGEKQGVDDFLAAGHTLDEVIELATTLPEADVAINSKSSYLMETQDGGLSLDIEKLINDLLAEYHFATLMDTEETLIYNEGVWKAKGEAFIKHECQRRVVGKEGGVSKSLTTYKVNEIIGHIRRTTYCDRSMFNRDKWTINLNNGLLDIRNGQLKAHTSQFLSTIRIPVEYEPHADCPRVEQFLGEILKPKDITVIAELFGYCLIPDYSVQRAFLFVGDGANGKSTLLNLLKEFIGRDNCSGVPWHALEQDRFAKSALEGKLVNMFADLPSQSLNCTGSFKMLTGGDSIGTEKKFKGYFTFSNYARLIFSTNKPPKVSDEDSYAFWRRWIIIDFPNEFIGERADKQLLAKLTTKDELSGLLNLAIRGFKRLFEQQDFSYIRSVEETTEMYQRVADPIYAFLQDVCESDPEGWVSKDGIYQRFRKYCLTNGIPLKKPNSFARALQNQTHFRVKSARVKIGGTQVAGWQGLRYRKDSEDSEDFSYLKVHISEDDNNSVNEIIRKNITNPTNPTMKPVEICPVCDSSDFWLRPDGASVCSRCHPKPGA